MAKKIRSPVTPTTWAPEEKTALCLLKFFYHINLQDLTTILNYNFSSRALAFTPRMITSVFAWSKKSNSNPACLEWDAILANSVFDSSSPSHEFGLQQLEAAAQVCGIALERRHTDKELRHHQKIRQRNTRIRAAKSGTRTQRAIQSTDVPQMQPVAVTATSRPIREAAHEHLPPRLLFRTFSESSSGINTPHEFYAGFYSHVKNPPVAPAPANWQEDEFLLDARNHFAGSETGTRLISTSPSLIWAIHRALKKDAVGEVAKISIINGYKASSRTGAYEAAPIIQEVKNRRWWPVGRWYRATQEILIWGKIEPPSIERCLAVRDLRDVASSYILAEKFLRLDYFAHSQSILRLRKEFFHHSIALDAASGQAVGLLSRCLGVTPMHDHDCICAVVYALLQGWVIYPAVNDEDLAGAWGGFYTSFAASSNTAMLVAFGAEEIIRSAFYLGAEHARREFERTKRYLRRKN